MLRKLYFDCWKCDGKARQNILDITGDDENEVDINIVGGDYHCDKCGATYYIGDIQEIVYPEEDED